MRNYTSGNHNRRLIIRFKTLKNWSGGTCGWPWIEVPYLRGEKRTIDVNYGAITVEVPAIQRKNASSSLITLSGGMI